MTNEPVHVADRHVGWAHINELLSTAAPSTTRIPGSPNCEIRIGVNAGSLALCMSVADDPEITPLQQRELCLQKRAAGGSFYIELLTHNPDLFSEFYTFACLVSDRVQIDGVEPRRAIDATMAAWTDLLRPRGLLSNDAEAGLVGELWFLLHIADHLGADRAVEAWKSARSEEHDFGLPRADVEVKTTVSESRRHMISSLTQMVPSPGRDLFLLSLQITTVGTDQEDAYGLATLVDESRATASTAGPETAKRLEDLLAGLKWRDEDRDLYMRRFRLRSEPVLVRVDDRFPSLVPALLVPLGELSARILHVNYRIDVTGLGFDLRSSDGNDLIGV